MRNSGLSGSVKMPLIAISSFFAPFSIAARACCTVICNCGIDWTVFVSAE